MSDQIGYVGLPELRAMVPSEINLNDDQIVRYELWRESIVTGRSSEQVAERYNCSPRMVYTWKNGFETEGLTGLLNRTAGPKGGHKVGPEIEQLIAEMRTEVPEIRSINEIADLLMTRHGHDVSVPTVDRVVRKLGLPQKKRGRKPKPKD